jgi:Predicted membrane protein (DUF2207) C-terminal domain
MHTGLLVAGGTLTAVWLLAVGTLRVLRQPRDPKPGPATLDLGAEPPAVANLLTRNFRVTPDAVPATLLDLAARRAGVEMEQTHPGAFTCRLRRRGAPEPLAPFEARVLSLLEARAADGVVPAGALTTGQQDESRRWFRSFSREVVADAQRRGLSRDLWDRRTLVVLYVAAVLPAVPFGLAEGLGAFALAAAGGGAVVAAIDAGRRQRDTPAGLDAGGRWLGVRDKLTEDQMFPTLPPTAVAVWERYLGYGAALGVARAAVAALPMGAESDTRAWSAYGGPWREVRVRYPRLLPPGWGMSPVAAIALGLGAGLVGGFVLSAVLRWGLFSDDSFPSVVGTVIDGLEIALGVAAGAVLLWGAICLVSGLFDLGRPSTVVGRVLRARVRGSDDHPRYYAAVDPGGTQKISAWSVGGDAYAGLQQGEDVRAVVTRTLAHVRSLERVPAAQNPRG